MAVFLRFRQVREDDRTVEYRFGSQEMTRRLEIEKDSLEGWIPEPVMDSDARRIYGKVLRLFEETSEWPMGGVYAA